MIQEILNAFVFLQCNYSLFLCLKLKQFVINNRKVPFCYHMLSHFVCVSKA